MLDIFADLTKYILWDIWYGENYLFSSSFFCFLQILHICNLLFGDLEQHCDWEELDCPKYLQGLAHKILNYLTNSGVLTHL